MAEAVRVGVDVDVGLDVGVRLGTGELVGVGVFVSGVLLVMLLLMKVNMGVRSRSVFMFVRVKPLGERFAEPPDPDGN